MQSPALSHTSPARLLRDRRSFIKLAGAGAIAALVAGKIEQTPRAPRKRCCSTASTSASFTLSTITWTAGDSPANTTR